MNKPLIITLILITFVGLSAVSSAQHGFMGQAFALIAALWLLTAVAFRQFTVAERKSGQAAEPAVRPSKPIA